ncbi:MFS transporter [Romboutsia weinsteinii]|uniref:MFS transporter n=1 Tax=Romboutsia weinsteinii TaxID=2020949 RepID=A0A371J5T3_9FIRM|nr:MFS transporter [Romboutsia weinsteinii]RDY28038.1 MFS transporter [Romboutsia weinsteinii]
MSLRNLLMPYKGLPREIYILFIGKIVNCIGAFVHPLMALILTQRIGMSASEAGQYVTMVAVCQAPCIMFGGKLADTIGRRKVIITFQILGAITLFICGLIEPSILTAKIMILSSCLYSLSTPAYDALNADLTNHSNRKSSYSLLYMGVNIGFAIGPLLGGFLFKNYLSLIFIGDAITTLISLALFIIFVKEKKGNIEEENTIEEKNNLEEKIEGSTLKVLLSRPILILFPIILLLYQFSYSQWGFAVPIQLGDLFGPDGAKTYGILGSMNGLIVIISTPILTTLTKKHNILNVMSVGGLLYGICFFLIGAKSIIPIFFLGVFLLTIGEVLIAINSSTFIANNTPASHRGRISSLIPLISGTGYAVGPMIMGGIIDVQGIFTGWMVVSMTSIIGSILMYNLKRFDASSKSVVFNRNNKN